MAPLLLLAAATAQPATPAPVEHLKKVVVDAIRNCPEPVAGEITVCARDRGIAEGYRLPRLDPRFAGPALRPSGRGALASSGTGATGTGSCSNVGASGGTGCSLRADKQWGAWKIEQQAIGQPFPW